MVRQLGRLVIYTKERLPSGSLATPRLRRGPLSKENVHASTISGPRRDAVILHPYLGTHGETVSYDQSMSPYTHYK